jgi:hypothetical protein
MWRGLRLQRRRWSAPHLRNIRRWCRREAPKASTSTAAKAATSPAAEMSSLILKRAPIGDNVEDFDVLADDKVVGRIFLAAAAPEGAMDVGAGLRAARGPHADTRGSEPTREAAMAAFAKSWRRES